MNSRTVVMRQRRLVRRAFTLLEIMLVILIIVMLAGVVVVNISGAGDKAKIGTTKVARDSIAKGLEMFKMEVGRYPTPEEGLESLVSGDKIQDDTLQKKWKGPYIESKGQDDPLKDKWEREYKYTCPGEHNTKSFDLSSAGPDGQEGSDDDITNWKSEN